MNRPETIENVLVKMHLGQWFGWTDSSDKVYANLVIHPVNGVTHPKPSETELTQLLADAQAEFDGNTYKRNREKGYPLFQEQLDMIFHDLEANDPTVTTWRDAIRAVKTKYPKPGGNV